MAAIVKVCLTEILSTADWSRDSTFYHRSSESASYAQKCSKYIISSSQGLVEIAYSYE